MSDRIKSSGLVQQPQQQNVRETRWTFIDNPEKELELELESLAEDEHNNDEQSECTELVSCTDQAYLFETQPLLNSARDQDEQRDYEFSGDNNADVIIGANQIEQREAEVYGKQEQKEEEEEEERDSNDQQRYESRDNTLFQFPNPISMSKNAQIDYNNWPSTSVAQATVQEPIEHQHQQQQSRQQQQLENSSVDQDNDAEENRAPLQQVKLEHKLVQPQQAQLKSSNNNQLLNNSSLAGSALSLCSLSRSSSSSSSASSSSSYSSSILSSSTSPSFSFSTSTFDQKLFVPFATFRSDAMTDKASTSSASVYDRCELMFGAKLPRENNHPEAGSTENQTTQVITIPTKTTISTTTMKHHHHHRHEGKYELVLVLVTSWTWTLKSKRLDEHGKLRRALPVVVAVVVVICDDSVNMKHWIERRHWEAIETVLFIMVLFVFVKARASEELLALSRLTMSLLGLI